MLADPHPLVVHFPIAWLPLALYLTIRDAWRAGRNRDPVTSVGGAETRESVPSTDRDVKAPRSAPRVTGRTDPPGFGTTDALLALICVFAIAAAATGNSSLAGYQLEGRAAELAATHSRIGGWVAWLTGAGLGLRGLLLLHLRGLARSSAGGRFSGGGSRLSLGIGSDRSGDARVRGESAAIVLHWAAALLVFLAASAAWFAGYYGGRLVHEEGVTRATAPHSAPEPETRDTYQAR